MRFIKIISVFIGSFALVSGIIINMNYVSKDNLEKLSPDKNYLDCVHFGVLYSNRYKLNLEEILLERNSSLQQVYTKKGEVVYFSYQYIDNTDIHWCIASLDINGTNMQVLCDEIFEPENIYAFSPNFTGDYKKRNGYYYKGEIVLTDFSKLIEYNITTDQTEVFEYGEYKHPAAKFECNIENYEEIIITTDCETHILKTSELIKNNDTMKTLFEKYDNKTINGTSACECFFDSVQIIDDDIYILCRVQRFDGCSYV
ncbi:MAG: hypothetical protein IKB93_15180 [Clostridia bacterium]|nr:hypothetical protein [Clostridia bacterium]